MFNLVPLCVEGVRTSQLIKIALIIFYNFNNSAIVAIGSGHLYGILLAKVLVKNKYKFQQSKYEWILT